MTNPLEAAFDAFTDAAEASSASKKKTLQMEALLLLRSWLNNIPASMLPTLIEQLNLAAQAQETSTNPLAGMLTFFGQVPSTGGATPLALGAGNGAEVTNSTGTTASTITPAQQELLDAFGGAPEQLVRIWADWRRRSNKLHGDQAQGFPLAVEEMLDGTLGIDPLGRPNAEAELKKKNSEITRLEKELADVKKQATQLETDLSKEKAKTPAVAGVSDELLSAVNRCVAKVATGLGFTVPTSVKADNEVSVLAYLKNQFEADFNTRLKDWQDALTEGRNAVEAVNDNKIAAREAYTALGKLTYDRRGIYGREEVGDALRKINPELPPRS